MLCRSYSLSAFAQFRDNSLTEIAVAYAQASDLDALSRLATHCPFAIIPQLLDILQSLPETMAIQDIITFIQKVCSLWSARPQQTQEF